MLLRRCHRSDYIIMQTLIYKFEKNRRYDFYQESKFFLVFKLKKINAFA